jgi:hypothetical protein
MELVMIFTYLSLYTTHHHHYCHFFTRWSGSELEFGEEFVWNEGSFFFFFLTGHASATYTVYIIETFVDTMFQSQARGVRCPEHYFV